MNKVWRIPAPIEVQGRRIVDTGGRPVFAHLIARLIPSDNPNGLRFEQEWENPEDSRWLSAIQTGIDQFVASRMEAGRPVGYTTLVMQRIISHDVDTDDAAVIYHVKAMLDTQFDSHATARSSTES